MSVNYPHPIPTKKAPPVNTGLVLSVGSQVGVSIMGIIIIALLVGLGLDALLQTTKHPFTILLFLGSAPFSLIVTYWLATRASKNLSSQKPAASQDKLEQEEGKRE